MRIYRIVYFHALVYIIIITTVGELRARATLGYRERKKNPQVGYVSHACLCTTQYTKYCIYILYTDYHFQIMIELAQLRQHKQRLNDLRTQLG